MDSKDYAWQQRIWKSLPIGFRYGLRITESTKSDGFRMPIKISIHGE